MDRPITGYGIDNEGDWFAFLSCGHRQHVRHQPPFISRPWVTTADGRKSMLGWPLGCVRCDRLEWPDNLVWQRHTAAFSGSNLPAALRQSHQDAADIWVRIVPGFGRLCFRIDSLDVEQQLTTELPGIVPPQTVHRIETADRSAVFRLELWRVPEAPIAVIDER